MKTIIRSRDLLIVGLLAALAIFNTAKAVGVPMLAAPIELAWDASPDASVTGYALYYSLADSSVTNRLDLGTAQSATLSNLEADSNYSFYVVGYNASGIESPPSNSLVYRPPALSPLRISKQTDGTMSMRFRAATGALCHVEFSPTLVPPQWQTLGSASADANGDVLINDPLSGSTSMRFYRGVRD